MTEASDQVSRETELRKLSYHQLNQIARHLNFNKNWQKLMMIIPKDISQCCASSTPNHSTTTTQTSIASRFKYTQDHMRMIEEAASSGRLPAQILFEEWGTSGKIRPTLAHLLQLLVEANLYRAADYLAVDILNENPPARPVTGPAAAIDIGSLLNESSGEDLNFDSRSVTFNGTSPRRIESARSTGQVPVMSELFGSAGLVSADEENSNAPTVSTNLQTDPVLEGFSDVDIPNLSILMNAAATGAPSSLIQSTSASDVDEELYQMGSRSYESVYQSNLPNISLFGGMQFAAAAPTLESQEESSSASASTPCDSSSTTTSVSEQSSLFANTNHSLPQLSFLMNNVQLSESSGTQSTMAESSSIPITIDSIVAAGSPSCPAQHPSSSAVQKFSFQHLLNCTNNFNDEYFTVPGSGGRKLGEGGFGQVYMAINLTAQIQVAAVKRLHRNFEQVKEKFELEIKILSEHSHENLVKLLGYSDEEKSHDDDKRQQQQQSFAGEMCLIYEFVAGGNLERRLELCRRGEALLSLEQRLGIALGVAKGIDYLHAAQLIHRDVKSANVLLTSGQDIPKLCDFGLLRPLNSRTTTMAVGSSGYMAPEIVRGTYDYEKVDIFAFGVLQLELLTGLPVLCAERREDLVTYVEKMVGNEADIKGLLDHRAGNWQQLGQRWYSEIVMKALELSPNRRSNIAECLQGLQEIVREVHFK